MQATIISGAKDDVVRKKIEHDSVAITQKLAKIISALNDYVVKTSDIARTEGQKFDSSLEGSVLLNETLAINSALVETGVEIKSVVKEMFLASTEEELQKLRTVAERLFSKASSDLGKPSLKNVQGVSAVQSSLSVVRQTLFARDGVTDKLINILKVRKDIESLNLTLKTIVNEQRNQGDNAMANARKDQEDSVKAVNKVFRSSMIGVVAIGTIVLILGILFSQLVGRSITKPIDELTKMAERFGAGDFNCRMDEKRNDEFGLLAVHFNQSSSKLCEIVSDLIVAIKTLGQSSHQISGVAEQLATGSHEQASQSIQSATTLEEMTSSISEVAQNANDAAQATQDASRVAASGQVTVSSTITGMQTIAESVKQAAETIRLCPSDSCLFRRTSTTVIHCFQLGGAYSSLTEYP